MGTAKARGRIGITWNQDFCCLTAVGWGNFVLYSSQDVTKVYTLGRHVHEPEFIPLLIAEVRYSHRPGRMTWSKGGDN